MVIDDARLVQGLIGDLADLSSLATEPWAQALIKSSQTIALELYRRADASEWVGRYAEGRRLIADAVACASAATPSHDTLTTLLAELPEALPPHLDARSRDRFFETIRCGIRVCSDGSGYPVAAELRLTRGLDAMFAWERRGYALAPPTDPEVPSQDRLVVVDAPMLERYLRSHWLGFEDARITAFTPIAGGFSKQTIFFESEAQGSKAAFVYRGATKIQIIEPVLVDIAQEFHVVSYAYSQGAPVAEPLWLQSDPSATGTRFFISRRVPGTNLGTAVQAHQPVPSAVAAALGEALAKIHALPLDVTHEQLGKSHLRSPTAGMLLQDVIRRRVDDWRHYFRSLQAPTFPALELAFQWLLDNVSASDGDAAVLVHGDYGLHNILIHDDRVSAVLDWEACHVGDRALDLSHILAGTAGKMDRELFMGAYIAAGGRAVSEFRLKYYQVLMSMQFMLSTIDAQHIFQRRAAAGTQYCTLGLGFIEYTANSVLNGIREASAARELEASAARELRAMAAKARE